MKTINQAVLLVALASATVCLTVPLDDKTAVRALEDRFTAALNAGDVDAMMKNYVPDESLVVFDVVPPKRHLGADAYRKAWVGFFATFEGIPKIAITDLGATSDGNLAFSHKIQRVTGIKNQRHGIGRRCALPTAIARSAATG
jgi:ketosteroid isomerase-like protein